MAMREDYAHCRLGRAMTRATSDDGFPDDFDWDYVSPNGLAVRDAWAMAMAWSQELAAHVSITVDETEALFAAIPNDEWIILEMGCCGVAHAAAMRASSLVWRALAACRGYGARENPVFWRRLIDELQHTKQQIHTRCISRLSLKGPKVTDANRFFDGVAFPRFKLVGAKYKPVPTVAQCVRVFCGLERPPPDDEAAISSKLTAILARLGSMASKHRLVESVEVSIQLRPKLEEESLVKKLICAIQDHSKQLQQEPDRDRFRCPLYLVPCLYLGSVDIGFCKETTWKWDTEFGSSTNTLIAKRSISNRYKATRLPFMQFLRWAMCSHWSQSTESVGVKELEVVDGGDEAIPAICASLPHTRSLETLHFVSSSRAGHVDDEHLAWIGYALFHPDILESSWQRLAFRGLHYNKIWRGELRSTHLWELMARGNNLPFVFQHSTKLVDAYFTATIKPGAVLLRRAGLSEKGDIVDELKLATRMDICATSTDLAELNDWVMVVLVGYGGAWVESKWVESITSRPPGRPKLTGLAFMHTEQSTIYGMKIDLRLLLQHAGRELEFVDLHGLHKTSATAALSELAVWCPHVSTLRLNLYRDSNNDVLPSNDFGGLQLPESLRHLRVSVKRFPCVMSFIVSSFDQLVRLESINISGSELITEAEVIELIPSLRALPRLRHCNLLHLQPHSLFWNDRIPTSYAMQRFFSRELLSPMAVDGPDTVALVNTRATSETLVALLSVVTSIDAESRTISSLDKVMIELISSFAGSFVKRNVWATGICTPKFVYVDEDME